MKTFRRPALLALSLFAGLALSAGPALAGDLVVEVTLPEGATGMVYAGVYDAEASFPKQGAERAGKMVKAEGRSARLVFTGLPAGRYALSAYLDGNGNAKLDTNVMGIPKEPYGFSRNARGSFGPPAFAEAAVDHDGGDRKIAFELK